MRYRIPSTRLAESLGHWVSFKKENIHLAAVPQGVGPDKVPLLCFNFRNPTVLLRIVFPLAHMGIITGLVKPRKIFLVTSEFVDYSPWRIPVASMGAPS